MGKKNHETKGTKVTFNCFLKTSVHQENEFILKTEKKGYIVPGDYLFNSSGIVHRKEIYQISYVVFDKIVQGWFQRTDERFGKNWRNTGQKLYPMLV